MIEVVAVDLSDAYMLFAFASAFGALWMMQRTTSDAGFRGTMPVIKLAHRVCSAAAAIIMFIAATDTLYNGTAPRICDFAAQVILIGVLAFSALRHMAAPLAHSSHNPGLN